VCGIAGIATDGVIPERAQIELMCDMIEYRGPDDDGYYLGQGIGLGMRRLAIIDVAHGQQPMSNHDGTVQVVFNGEIYNYRKLRNDLAKKGYTFRTNSDTEILPHLYDEFGLDFLELLNGIFAIALWDEAKKRLLLARDRVGIKPLYFSERSGKLFFGSEVKCILAVNGSDRAIDPIGLDQYLTFEYTASPATLLTDVRKLEPGGWVLWQAGSLRKGSYWSPPSMDDTESRSEEEWLESVRETFEASVGRQLVSDVPLGTFLSGGIDSSILVATVARISGSAPKTFSVGFKDQSYDELSFARAIASRYETEHYEEILDPDYRSLVPDIIWHLDQPIGDFSVFPTLLVSQMARKHVTVALGGDGGDELFAGYDSYLADKLATRFTDWLPESIIGSADRLLSRFGLSQQKRGLRNSLRRFLEGARQSRDWQHMRWMVFLSSVQKTGIYESDFLESTVGNIPAVIDRYLDRTATDRLQSQMNCDARFYLCENILTKVDLMSMSTALEARVPYLDNEMLDLAYRMPSKWKYRHGTRKYILKEAFKQYLPPEIFNRGKEGFSIPMKTWLASDWRDLVHDVLSESSLRADGHFRPAGIRMLIDEHEKGVANHSHVIWGLLVYFLWKQTFVVPTSLEPRPVRTWN